MRKSINQILEEADEKYRKKDKIKQLQSDMSPNLILFFDYVYGNYEWSIPKMDYKFRPTDDDSLVTNTRFLANVRKLHYFMKHGPYPNMPESKKILMLISLLETFSIDDSNLLIYVINNGKLPQRGLTKDLILEAVPQLKEKWTK